MLKLEKIENTYRDALLEIKSAMESLMFAPPESRHVHLNRIQEELDDLPEGWDKPKDD